MAERSQTSRSRSSAWQRLERRSRNAPHFLNTSDLAAQPWVRALPAALPPPPPALAAYLRDAITDCGSDDETIARALALDPLLLDATVAPPPRWGRVMSGSGETACLFDPASRCAPFIAELFAAIVRCAPAVGTTIALNATDLYHAHCFATAWQDDSGACVADLGLLFHAKEYPAEFRRTRFGDTHPIGAEEMGGADDPRVGTKTSTEDEDFARRNFVWFLSTNTLWLVDPLEPSFVEELAPSSTPCTPPLRRGSSASSSSSALTPRSLLMNTEFATVDVGFFCGEPLWDVNLFVDHSEAARLSGGTGSAAKDSKEAALSGCPLLCPRGGVDATLKLRALFARVGAAPSDLDPATHARTYASVEAIVHRLTPTFTAALRAALVALNLDEQSAPSTTDFGALVAKRLPRAWWSTVRGVVEAQAEEARLAQASHNAAEHLKLADAVRAALGGSDECGVCLERAALVEQGLRLSEGVDGSRSSYRALMLLAVLHPALRSASLRREFGATLRCVDDELAQCAATRDSLLCTGKGKSVAEREDEGGESFRIADARVAMGAAFYDSSVLEVLRTAIREEAWGGGGDGALDAEEIRRIAVDVVERKTAETNAQWEAAQRARIAAAEAAEAAEIAAPVPPAAGL